MTAGSVADARGRWSRRRILPGLAGTATFFSAPHHADHVARRDHLGWPFTAEVTPFTSSLPIYAFILPGIYLTARGRSIALYHLIVATGWLAMLGFVHFVPVGGHEAPISDIYASYDSPAAGLLALAVLTGLLTSVGLLAVASLRAILRREPDGGEER